MGIMRFQLLYSSFIKKATKFFSSEETCGIITITILSKCGDTVFIPRYKAMKWHRKGNAMKKTAVVVLMVLLLVGCAVKPIPSESTVVTSGKPDAQTEVSATGTDRAETESEESTSAATEEVMQTDDPSGVGTEALVDGDKVLFFRQDQIQDDELLPEHRGDPVSLEALYAWNAAQTQLPRTHYYDEAFSDQTLLLNMLDYCISEGYAGVTLPRELVDLEQITDDQYLSLFWMYRIDNAIPQLQWVYDEETDDWSFCAVWFQCPQPDSVERFHTALEKARQIVAEIPPGLDEYDRAQYLYSYLKTNVEFNQRGANYYNDDWYFLYDALIEGKCVCTGYSDALYYLFNLAGIDCVCLLGDVEGSEFNEAQRHQWNAASLYGTYYCFDVTWDDKMLFSSENSCFAVSEDMLNGISQRSRPELLNGLFPSCPSGFRPPEEWNQTPEGALRSYLWLREYCFGRTARGYLLQTDQLLYSEQPIKAIPGSFVVYDKEYAPVAESFMLYITQACYLKTFEGKCFRNENGKLAVSGSAGNAVRYRIESVSGAENSYTAQLISEQGNKAVAAFTVIEENGRYKINTCSIRGE